MELVGCTKNYQCGEIKTVQSGHTLSPWVRVVFRDGGGNMITVGNKSSPSLDNSAVIKSFNYGFSNGADCKIVIHDTMGSSLSVFLKNMMKEFKDSDDRIVQFEWGWTNTGCESDPPPPMKSDVHFLSLAALETNYIQGKFIHEITALDVMNTATQGGIEKLYGETGKNAISLKSALEKLLKEKPKPIVKEIKYCRLENGKMVCGVGFKEGKNGEGPEYSWRGNAANKLEVAKKWISSHCTDRDKNFEMQYDSTVDGGTIIFMEKPTKDCDEAPDESLCIGTYVVNGGRDTPVIEFNPRIKWDFGPVGANGGNMSINAIEDPNAPHNKSQGNKKCVNQSRAGNEGAGQVLSTPTTEEHKELNGKNATTIQNDANSKQLLLDGIHIMDNGIMADMVIVGDPRFPTQYDGVIDGKTIAVAFVNPFHIMPSGDCGDWLAKPPCNAILGQKDWFIQKVNHRIEGGTYTTSLTLRLTSDGLDAPVGAHIK